MNGLGGVVLGEWLKVIYGMLFSLFAGFLFGWLFVRVIERVFNSMNRRTSGKLFVATQDVCAALLSFLHGAQDGQKFMSIAILGISLAFGMESANDAGFPLWLMIVCSLAISLGTFLGGERIIKSVAMDMVKLEKYQGFSASISATISLLVATLTGLPVSTTHAKTAAIMGSGAAKNVRSVNWNVAKEMVYTWVFTFPGCGVIGYALARFFLMVF